MDDKANKPENSDFKQQRLQGWTFVVSSPVLGLLYLALGVFFIVYGTVIVDESDKVVEVSQRYDDINDCRITRSTGTECTIDLELSEDMTAPIFFYYVIQNLYQNHRKYNKSRDIIQLMGSERSVSEIDNYCDPIVTMEDLGLITDLELNEDDPANPCGLMAKSVFNDTYSLASSAASIEIDETNIAWDIDVEQKFDRADNWEDIQWTDVEDEHFIVWMNTAALPSFRKLWGRIDQDLPAGTYQLTIQSNYDVTGFEGQKSVLLSTTSAFGGDVGFLGVLFIVAGSVALAGGLLMFLTYFLKQRTARRYR